MNSKMSSRWLQILYGLSYGSLMGLGFGVLFGIAVLGGMSVLAWILHYSGII